MAKIPAHIQLSDAEIDAFLQDESRCRIATISAKGEINLTPMTFGWANGCIYIFGRGQKIADLRRNPTATVLIDTGDSWPTLKGLMMRGQAVVLEDANAEAQDPGLADARLNVGQKSGLVKDDESQPYAATASGRSRRWIVFKPDSKVSWYNERL